MQKNFISLEQKIFEWGNSNPEKTAIIENEINISYGSLINKIQLYVYIFKNILNIKKHDHVLLIADRTSSFIASYFALHMCHIIAVVLDPEVSSSRFNFIKEKTNAQLLIGIQPGFFFDQKIINIEQIAIEIFSTQNINYNFNSIEYPPKNNFADLIFTTGTTGIPKGVYLTIENIAASSNNINSFIKNVFEDIELVALPLSHSFGLGRIRCVLSAGGTIVICNSFTNVKRFFKLIEKHNVSGLAFVPSAILYILKMSGDKINKFAKQINYIEIGSAHLTIENKIKLINLLPNTRICMHYGLTEASRSTFLELTINSKNLDSIGKPSPNVEICIMNESGYKQPIETQGEICVKGMHVARNYLGLSTIDTQKFFWNDYLRTGDNGILSSEGFIKLVGRKSDIINIGGKKVHPTEIEEVLNKIENIDESVCIGIPDPYKVMGEVVMAYLKGKSDLVDIENVKQILASKLESYKCPIEYKWIDEIPKTESGKLKRNDLKNI